MLRCCGRADRDLPQGRRPPALAPLIHPGGHRPVRRSQDCPRFLPVATGLRQGQPRRLAPLPGAAAADPLGPGHRTARHPGRPPVFPAALSTRLRRSPATDGLPEDGGGELRRRVSCCDSPAGRCRLELPHHNKRLPAAAGEQRLFSPTASPSPLRTAHPDRRTVPHPAGKGGGSIHCADAADRGPQDVSGIAERHLAGGVQQLGLGGGGRGLAVEQAAAAVGLHRPAGLAVARHEAELLVVAGLHAVVV